MNIYVGNLPFTMTEEELRSTFAEHGEVSSSSVIIDRNTGRSRGFAFVVMPNEEEARAAIEALDGHPIAGRELRVNAARNQETDHAR